MATYTVVEAEHGSDKPDKGYGPMKILKLTLRGPDGKLYPSEWFTKAATPVPSEGTPLEGDLSPNKYGPPEWSFKKARGNFSSTGGGSWKPRDPSETAAIQRQHSQGVAARIAIAAGWFKTGWNPHEKDDASVLADLARLTDWVQRDITRGVKLAQRDTNSAANYGEQKNPQPTGQSDVPNDAPVHPPVSADDKIPF